MPRGLFFTAMTIAPFASCRGAHKFRADRRHRVGRRKERCANE